MLWHPWPSYTFMTRKDPKSCGRETLETADGGEWVESSLDGAIVVQGSAAVA